MNALTRDDDAMTCESWNMQTMNAGYWFWNEDAIREGLAKEKARKDEQDRLDMETALEFQGDQDRVRGVTRECPRGTECV